MKDVFMCFLGVIVAVVYLKIFKKQPYPNCLLWKIGGDNIEMSNIFQQFLEIVFA